MEDAIHTLSKYVNVNALNYASLISCRNLLRNISDCTFHFFLSTTEKSKVNMFVVSDLNHNTSDLMSHL